jgi:hypothetical protein
MMRTKKENKRRARVSTLIPSDVDDVHETTREVNWKGEQRTCMDGILLCLFKHTNTHS